MPAEASTSTYQAVIPYLIVKDAENFINFMQTAFNAAVELRHMRDDNTIRHAEIMVDNCKIMFAEMTAGFEENNAGFFITVANADESFKKAIDAGASIVTPLQDQPYGRSGGVLDPFGNTWWITSMPK